MKLYSTKEAAEYLELGVSAIKYHIHVAKNLHPLKVGNSLVFTQEQLDEFKANRRSPGRPRNEEWKERFAAYKKQEITFSEFLAFLTEDQQNRVLVALSGQMHDTLTLKQVEQSRASKETHESA